MPHDTNPAPLAARLKAITGQAVAQLAPLHGGDVADVRLATLSDGSRCVVKLARPGDRATLAVEGAMLRDLAATQTVPVPRVIHAEADLLLMTHIPHRGGASADAAADMGHKLATLHRVGPPDGSVHYGYAYDTVIGPLPQPNGWLENWPGFFRARRLMPVMRDARAEGRLSDGLTERLETLMADLDRLLPKRPAPGLVHGDLWAGNMLLNGDRLAGLIDPALFFGHREMDLAMIDLMGGLGDPFFEEYDAAYPIRAGFFRTRRLVYQLWPLLVHVRLFGGMYKQQLSSTLDRLGY
ncbi:fructosamine kinase family protein [Yunchengibacter salinarum]|uniref:fructosamine kinase family protein n=1 Tax=Yunchengibacter salinarum TaxID=3133399 RepID=UPI0035B66843